MTKLLFAEKLVEAIVLHDREINPLYSDYGISGQQIHKRSLMAAVLSAKKVGLIVNPDLSTGEVPVARSIRDLSLAFKDANSKVGSTIMVWAIMEEAWEQYQKDSVPVQT